MFKKLANLDKKIITHFSHNDMDGYAPRVLSTLSKLTVIDTKNCSYSNFEKELDDKLSFFENHDYLEQYGLLITDISPTSKEMVERLARLHSYGLAIVLLDHHDTAKWIADKYPEWAFVETNLNGRLTCGTELQYKYLLEKELIDESKLLSSFVEHVRSYDTWDWFNTFPNNTFAKELNNLLYVLGHSKWIERQLSKFKCGIDVPDYFFDAFEQALVDIENKKEEYYIRSKNTKMKKHQWHINGKTYNVGSVFAEQYISTLGNKLSMENEDLDFVAIIDPSSNKVSLRTVKDGIHLGELAKEIGSGGGHPKAAGFQLQEDCSEKILSKLLRRKSIFSLF